MKFSQPTPGKQKSKKAAGIIIAMILFVIVGGYVFFRLNTFNYAEELAKPIEKTLIGLGAKKVCGSGDTGRGWDNKYPLYGSYLVLKANSAQAKKDIQQAFSDHGFTATHATLQNRGPVSVADKYINNELYDWYYDQSKPSPYSTLSDGNSILMAETMNDGDHTFYCGDSDYSGLRYEKMTSNEKQTIISIDVKLPKFK